ncbi:tRNA glutamyl-Q(34) synthetase GluQRS [Agathobaculum sp.]|uniref:tRNA glutamyl-Q(34) synthetase GluQRS n=1 Tax=Agathobaculum sp. TaxID=2048138 RepID=UPI002A80BD2B|nr:tRNA glutamyl-Q(34) synthetase GluQRS [Agathobaculum sp.]MDY3619387.1 tRNA glutamyl-Q(34) synthetase GluQRS [Agathobaculum sp.]
MGNAAVGRFAPSPSGRMHLGNVLCALLAWLSARKQGGRYLLRIEDLDEMRCPRSFAGLILDDLRWLGLDWDGEVPYQSERTALYERYEAVLREIGLLYPCFCSRAALHAASAPHLSDGRVVYAGTCRDLTPDEAAEKKKVRAPATRLRVPDEEIVFTDGVFGAYRENLARECGDFIIRRSDGVFAYQLAVVVDDALSGVTEVVRGSDLLSSTPRQIWLHRLLGFTPPDYIHIPLLCGHDGRRLSKRDEDLDLGLLRERFSPERIVGALACAAGLTDRPEPVPARELIGGFSWDRVPRHDLLLPDIFQ